MDAASTSPTLYTPANIRRDLVSGLVVFLVALPLCLGIALASNAPMISGLIAGIVGGLVVGILSGSHTSVSGPAAGLAAIVVTQLETLGSFSTFALCVVLAGVMQLGLGIAKAGFLASFFPTSVIRGLLAAIGILLILKQFPHVLGHDPDPVGEMGFSQPDGRNTFTELLDTISALHMGAALIGLLSVALLVCWEKIAFLKKTGVPAPLVVVGLGLGLGALFQDGGLAIGSNHLVQMPRFDSVADLGGVLDFADFSQLGNPAVYVAALTIAIVASLETLLNLEAVDNLDPQRRSSPPNRELFAQGAGNICAGLIGGLPITSVVVRGSVNVGAGNRTRMSAVFHGLLLLVSVMFLVDYLNRIPLACLAAILLVTGFKLASPILFRQMWAKGRSQFLPFIATILAIVFVDLLVGVVVGLVVSVCFILYSNFKRPLRKYMEHHAAEDVLRVQLSNQVSFFQKAAIERTLEEIPAGGHVLLDARDTDYIDPDVLHYLQEFKNDVAPARNIDMSLVGFRDRYKELEDKIEFVDYTSKDLQNRMPPAQVLELLRQGNERFRSGRRLERDLVRQVEATADGQSPFAVVLSCIDSRCPPELIFDLGIGDIFSVRVAGNVATGKLLGSIEYSCQVAGAKLLLVLGNTSSGAVTAAVDLLQRGEKASAATGCANLDSLIDEIQAGIDPQKLLPLDAAPQQRKIAADDVSRDNVLRTMRRVREQSSTLAKLLEDDAISMVGGLYDIKSGEVAFFDEAGRALLAGGSSSFSSDGAPVDAEDARGL